MDVSSLLLMEQIVTSLASLQNVLAMLAVGVPRVVSRIQLLKPGPAGLD